MYRKYYKFGTTINGTVTGSPTINNGVVSGFSSSKYITSTLPIPQEGINTFEVYTKIITPSTLNAYGAIIAPSKDGTHWISFQTQYSSQDDSIALVFYDNDTYFGYQAVSSNVQTSTTYWCKWIYDGTNVKGYYSLDGNTYTLVSTTASSSQLTNALSKFITSNIRIGCSTSGDSVNNGSIDLTRTYIKINGNIVWSGTNIEEGTSSDYIFYKDFYNYKAKKESVIHYYRYVGSEEPWTQPSISANGTLGGDSFAVAASSEESSYEAYKAFTSNGWVNSRNGGNGYFIFYNPNALKVTSLSFSEARFVIVTCYINTYDLYGSKDNSTWDLIGSYTQGSGTHTNTIENTEFYNYYKIQSTSVNGCAAIKNLVITATQGSSAVEESLSPFANVNLVGEPFLANYKISGFSTNDYATLQNVFSPEGDDFEIVLKFTTPNDFTTSSNNRFLFFTNTSGTPRGISIHCQANTNSLACAFTNSDNTGWDNSLGGNFITNNLQPSTIYWVKLKRENDTLYKYYSLNGIEYILNESSPISMTVPAMVNTYLGTRYDDSTSTAYEYWSDVSIDLSECYIKLNNAYFWKGVDYDFSKKEYKYKLIKAVEESSSSTGYSTYTFEPYSALKKWIIPEGITKVHVDCVATRGKSGKYTGGYGGRVQTDLSVTPGQTLYVYVGKNQESPNNTKIAYYNAADIRTDNTGILDTTSLQSRIIVAGAGGNGANTGSSKDGNETIGAGGGLEGATGGSTGYSVGGAGGTQSSGGGFGIGSNGSSSEHPGAGGAGWYGGKGGSYHGHNSVHYNGGGGGGSSYTDSTLCENVVHTQGYNSGEGYITISAINGTDIIYYSEDTFIYKTPKF